MERVSVFWTGVSCLVDWFFSSLLLRLFDASTDTSVRVSDTAVVLCEDSAPNSAEAAPVSGLWPVGSWY